MDVQCHRNIAACFVYTNRGDQKLASSIPGLGAARAPAEVEAGGVLLGEEASRAVAAADHVRAGEPFLREAIAAAVLVRVVWVCRRLLPLGLEHGEGRAACRRRCRRVQERWTEPSEGRLLERRAGVRRRLDVVEHHAGVAVRGAVLADRRGRRADRRLALLRGVIGGRLRLGQLLPQLPYLRIAPRRHG